MTKKLLVVWMFCAMASAVVLAPVSASKQAVAASSSVVTPSLWQVDKEKSRLEFSGLEGGKPFKGEFKSFDCHIIFDKEHLSSSSVKVNIDTASVVTGDKLYDDALPGTDWLSVKSFPFAVYQSSSLRQTGDKGQNSYEAVGTLDLIGHMQPVTLPFSLQDVSADGKTVRATGQFILKRLDFSLGKAVDATGSTVANDILVKFDITAARN